MVDVIAKILEISFLLSTSMSWNKSLSIYDWLLVSLSFSKYQVMRPNRTFNIGKNFPYSLYNFSIFIV